jgi:alkylated DNA repair dioxygenase AlkB
MKTNLEGFICHQIGADFKFFTGKLSDALLPSVAEFDSFWEIHPQEYHEIKIHGRLVKTPRWQQAFGVDYHYTGRINKAFPVPPVLEPFLRWSRVNIDDRLNGILLNWYDGALDHYIGAHRDSIKNMVPGCPIVTISVGEERIFRIRRWPARVKAEPVDFSARHGTVFVMPWETNQAFTHEVPSSTRHKGRRISITLRAFG